MSEPTLTPAESLAIEQLTAAIKALPESLCLEIDDGFNSPKGLVISKRKTKSWCCEVARIRKASIVF